MRQYSYLHFEHYFGAFREVDIPISLLASVQLSVGRSDLGTRADRWTMNGRADP
jgi:hypothetical protein